MRVTLMIEVDALDGEDKVVGRISTTSFLDDDLGVYPADILTTYDSDRHAIMIKLAEKGQHPRWDYRPRSGQNSKLSLDLSGKCYPAPPSTDPTGLPVGLTGGTRDLPVKAQDAL